MSPLSAPLLLNGFVALAVVIVILYTLAIHVRCSVELHQLKVEAHHLRIAYLKRLAALRGELPEEEELVGVDVVEDVAAAEAPAPEPATPAAAAA